MIKKKEELKTIIHEAMKGGPGQVQQMKFVEKDDFKNLNVFAHMKLEKNCGLGLHEHNGESELYYVLKGEAEYTDDEKIYTIKAGDVTVCYSGHKHAITNKNDEPFEYIALIVID